MCTDVHSVPIRVLFYGNEKWHMSSFLAGEAKITQTR